MQVAMEVHRSGGQYHGSLTHSDGRTTVWFVGVLELVAALEALLLQDTGGEPQGLAVDSGASRPEGP